MKRPESILSSHYNSGVVRRASSFVSFLFSLAKTVQNSAMVRENRIK
jgi:hypothetical protein